MFSLHTSVEDVPKISRRIVPALKRLGIKTVRDLLLHFPSRYEDFSDEKRIRDVKAGEVVTVQGKIVKISGRRTARRHIFLVEATIEDDSGKINPPTFSDAGRLQKSDEKVQPISAIKPREDLKGGRIKALWFNQQFLLRNLKVGQTVNLSGKVALGSGGLYLQNPAYERIENLKFKIENSQSIHTGGLIAVYPETSGITSRWLRFLIKHLIDLREEFQDPLPLETRRRNNFPGIKEVIYSAHFPKVKEEAEKARRRLIFEKMLLVQLRALTERSRLKSYGAPVIKTDIALLKEFTKLLPFQLTDAQRRSLWEIVQDIAKPRPMNRLLEGDVGSGKTVVAAAAALLASRSGFKAVFMAPTEILARQHFATLENILKPFKIKIGLVVGAEKIFDKNSSIIIGTHALIQKGVELENLGLVVVDEQHRFGVEQRAKLLKQNTEVLLPHFLSMSATPIPRTLALTIYGDLDLSIIDEMPKSRKPIITKVVEPEKREVAYRFIREEVKRGRQVFVICPRIEISTNNESNTNKRINESKLNLWEVKAVKEEHKKLSEETFPDLKVGMLHGKLKSKEKESVMKKFREKEIDILVSTSVIEVGIDIPNATIMMIEGAERFGLAQLHQFRGRVGRGEDQAYCFLFTTEDGMAARRLRAVEEAKSGLELAEKDLEIRGPGEIFGLRQSGIPDAALEGITDVKLVREVRREAVELIRKSPDLKLYPELLKELNRFSKTVHLE